ncbi:hypothetical protein PG985_014901 [Apiospora marii]|uniref:DUF3592 domain-containing protein n=1 Tax=Apiospora marii TaxID=335849 RepID=A0ABR1RJU2_9PEZI
MSPPDYPHRDYQSWDARRVFKYILVILLICSIIAAPIAISQHNIDREAARAAAMESTMRFAPKLNGSLSTNGTSMFVSRVNRAAHVRYPRDGTGVRFITYPSHGKDGTQTSGAAAGSGYLSWGALELVAVAAAVVALAWDMFLMG